jgi:RNA polymerase sigma factor (TIGR02999 family)
MSQPPGPVTVLLQEWRKGDRRALDRLIPLVYDELRRVADRRMNHEADGHTLHATALVHEAYERLAGADVEWQDRAHFFAVAAGTMRRILVDHARARSREKRGGGRMQVTLSEQLSASAADDDLLDLDEALGRLAAFDERKARIVEMVFFGGLTQPEVGEVMGISTSTVERELRAAKAWLAGQLRDEGDA